MEISKNSPAINFASKHCKLTFPLCCVLLFCLVICCFRYPSTLLQFEQSRESLSVFLVLLTSYITGRVLVYAWQCWKNLFLIRKLWEDRIQCVKFVFNFDVPILFVLLPFMFLYISTWNEFILPFVFNAFLSVLYHTFNAPTVSEVQELCEEHCLNIGHGAACFYYYNYLNNFIPHEFSTRIKHFSALQGVPVYSKLVILLPYSCKVKKYIDDDIYIERSRELIPYYLDIGGVHKREYNITVYKLVRNKMHDDCVWCSIEYAQPLKQLWDMKDRGQITENLMHQERTLFIQKLQSLLDDEHDCHRSCELLEFDDTKPDFNLSHFLISQKF